jgi:hypothetical protein
MTKTKFLGMVLFSLLIALGVSAQQLQSAPPAASLNTDKPVWALEFVKVKPGMFAATMGYLDDNWLPFSAVINSRCERTSSSRSASTRRDRKRFRRKLRTFENNGMPTPR